MWFFKPAWQSKNKDKALKAVAKETDQRNLAEIYHKAQVQDVRNAAMQRLTDQTVLAELAKSRPYDSIALMEIIEKLTDQSTLADIAQNSGIANVRIAALDKLTDQNLAHDIFTDIIRKSKKVGDVGIRMGAVRILTNQNMLAELAKNDIIYSVRAAAVEKLTDQEALTQIAKYDVMLNVRLAAAKRLTDRGLAEEIVNKIELSKRKNIEPASGIGTATEKQPLSYDEFVNSVKSFMNIRDYDKVQKAIQTLTNQDVLAEIIKSSAKGWHYDRGADNYGPYNIIDLRDTARARLDELQRSKPQASPQAQPEPLGAVCSNVVENPLLDHAPGRKPNTDLFFIVEALKNAPTIPMQGLINGLVVMTPSFTKTIQKFPRNAERLYQIGLNSLTGPEIPDLIQNPTLSASTRYYGTVTIFTGFPQLCLKCRKPVEKYELLMAPVANPQGIQGRVSISADNAQEIFDVLQNVRNFFAVPCCAEHSLANRFFFWMGMSPLFTDDEDIANTCMIYSTRTQSANPVKVVNGKIVD